MPVIYFIAMLILLGCGIGVLAVNSRRGVNRVFAGICFICTLYFAFTIVSRYAAFRYFQGEPYRGMPWIRLTWTMTALMPLYLWALFYVVSGKYRSARELVWKLLPWGVVTASLVVLTWTQYFVTDANLPDKRTPGPGFIGFQLVLLVSAFALLARSIVVARRLKGIRKLEFLYLTINCGALSVFAVLLPLLTFLPVELRKLVTIPIVCYGITGWSLATRRVYHSTHIYLSLIEHAVVIGAAGIGAIWAISIADRFGINVYARIAIVGVFILASYHGHEWLRRWLHLKPEHRVEQMRQRLVGLAEREGEPDAFILKCEATLAEWAQTPRVLFLRLEGDHYRSGDAAIPLSMLRVASGFREGWVTPASLDRGRMNARDQQLRDVMIANQWGAMVVAGWPDSTPTLLAVFADRESESPFTYPEIKALQELAQVVEGYYTRARLRLQARQAEQLAVIGRIGASVAHELRNPVETLRSFAEMLPQQRGNAEFMRDFVELVPKETERALALVEQILDLAKPRKYHVAPIDVHAVIQETTRLMTKNGREQNAVIAVTLNARRHTVLGDANALRQVTINLLKNALEATAANTARRAITISTKDDAERVTIEVEDNGPGIPAEIREKLFTPFATSGKRNGLGLGLAICQEIASSHYGTISVADAPRGGTVFRVSLPLDGDNGNPTD